MIVNDNALTNYLYYDYIKGSYIKIYSMRKRKERLLIITNY